MTEVNTSPQPLTPQERREELLREFFKGNLEYQVHFDQKDMKMRDYYLRKGLSGGWLGLGVMGMGYFNYRLVASYYPEYRNTKWGVLAGFLVAGTGIMVANYFRVKLESQEYLRQKYLVSPTTLKSETPNSTK